MDPALVCKLFFVLSTTVLLGGVLVPSMRESIMNYGSRLSNTNPKTKDSKQKGVVTSLMDFVASLKVPHPWFTHFYVVSVASSIFWAFQITTRGFAFQYLASHSHDGYGGMSVNQAFLAWLFMAIQGIRRAYESFTLTKPSQSKMWVGLWILGIAYYIFMGVSVWIEGIGALNESRPLIEMLEFSRPSIKTLIASHLFVLGSAAQHICHKHLASLKKYTLPNHPFFRFLICPHYTSECLIYVAIAIVATPEGQIMNRTMLAGSGMRRNSGLKELRVAGL
ncbi:3-oxo-5-alpha-steroid 4-dehydrogenase-like protein [Venustampulla echinocandica]|uniref:Polyprenal reductase n=1 Tax=Venustampulla echinocandica TaxID=2656787 RepID=A0A370TY08_9HELO|nr:3-oxo-5-alpha-steroid 4-dehydrogenase-like protein [Venustampulla echinocandica]RDL40407.1 3-oxo-5-alpha-steroid 4-dehydrogenase-like protein [Venustampulla echinocandica]